MAQRSTFRPGVEGLEDRQLLAASPVYLSGGHIVINGTQSHDKVDVSLYSGRYWVYFNGRYYGGYSTQQVRDGARVYFYGNYGDDRFSNNTHSLNTVAYGGAGNDELQGGDSRFTWDYLDGGTGNDTLTGFSGTDYLYGGAGADNLDGGLDADYVDAGAVREADAVWYRTGVDRLVNVYSNDIKYWSW